MTIQTIESADGTQIAFETTGKGPPLILVGGAFCDRSARASGTPLAALLEDRFTVLSYDRRGRGQSGDLAGAGAEREVEDLAAILGVFGGSASVFGNSSGGLLAVDAAVAGLAIAKLVLYEPPIILDPARAVAFAALAEELDREASAGRRSAAVELFLGRVMNMPPPAIEGMQRAPLWSGLEALAHTLGLDLRVTARGPSRLAELPKVRAETLVLDGGASAGWMRDAIATFASAFPDARRKTLAGQTHAVDPRALATAIEEFLAA